jgi:hypothetical protein
VDNAVSFCKKEPLRQGEPVRKRETSVRKCGTYARLECPQTVFNSACAFRWRP